MNIILNNNFDFQSLDWSWSIIFACITLIGFSSAYFFIISNKNDTLLENSLQIDISTQEDKILPQTFYEYLYEEYQIYLYELGYEDYGWDPVLIKEFLYKYKFISDYPHYFNSDNIQSWVNLIYFNEYHNHLLSVSVNKFIFYFNVIEEIGKTMPIFDYQSTLNDIILNIIFTYI